MPPEEVRVDAPTGNGGQLQLRVGSKSVGLSGPIIVPVVCLILVGAIGWLRSADLKESLREVNTHLQKIYDRQESIRNELKDQTKEMLTALRDNREATGEKLQVIATQTTELRQEIVTQTSELVRRFEMQTHEIVQRFEAQTNELTKRLSILSFNMDRPIEQRLPLNVDPTQLPPPERAK